MKRCCSVEADSWVRLSLPGCCLLSFTSQCKDVREAGTPSVTTHAPSMRPSCLCLLVFRVGTIYGFPEWSRWLISPHRDRAPASPTQGLGVPERKSHHSHGLSSGEARNRQSSSWLALLPSTMCASFSPVSREGAGSTFTFRWGNRDIEREGSSLGA